MSSFSDYKITPREYVMDKFPDASIRQPRKGESIKIKCPFHEEAKPSMNILVNTGVFNCFGCRKHGDFIKLYKLLEDVSWKEAKEKCLRVFTNEEDGKVYPKIVFPENLISCKVVMPPYLRKRNFSQDDLLLFDIHHNNKAVFFPIYDKDKNFVSYGKRNVSRAGYFYPAHSPHMNFLYGEHIELGDTMVIVEGMLDVIAVNRLGFSGLATFTQNFSDVQVSRIKTLSEGKKVFILYDSDATDKIEDLDYELVTQGVNAAPIFLDENDPAGLPQEELRKIILNN